MSISADIFCKSNETCWNTRGPVSLRTTNPKANRSKSGQDFFTWICTFWIWSAWVTNRHASFL